MMMGPELDEAVKVKQVKMVVQLEIYMLLFQFYQMSFLKDKMLIFYAKYL